MKATSKPLPRSTVLDAPADCLDDYLDRVNRTLLARTHDIDLDISAAVDRLKHTAIAQGVWDFYPTPQLLVLVI